MKIELRLMMLILFGALFAECVYLLPEYYRMGDMMGELLTFIIACFALFFFVVALIEK